MHRSRWWNACWVPLVATALWPDGPVPPAPQGQVEFKEVRSFPAGPNKRVRRLTFTADSAALVTAGGVEVRWFDAATGKELLPAAAATRKYELTALALSPDQ